MRLKSSQASSKGFRREFKGKGKGQGKDQTGKEICFSWAKDQGACTGLSPGSECKGKVKRVHKCMHLLVTRVHQCAVPEEVILKSFGKLGLRRHVSDGFMGILGIRVF